jgi:hypothetical protein
MTEAEIEVILRRARERYQEPKPRIISDNGPRCITPDFKEFIRIAGMTRARSSHGYPQSPGASRETTDADFRGLQEEAASAGQRIHADRLR